MEVAEKRGIRDGERKFGLVSFHFYRIFIPQSVKYTLCVQFFEGLILESLLKQMLIKKKKKTYRRSEMEIERDDPVFLCVRQPIYIQNQSSRGFTLRYVYI